MTAPTTHSEIENPLLVDDALGAASAQGVQAVSIKCPHCYQLGSFFPAGGGCTYQKKVHKGGGWTTYSVACFVRICPNESCRGLVMVVDNGKTSLLSVLPNEVLDFDAKNLPDNLLQTLKEAISCHSVGAYRASAMMVRRLLEEICEESGATGKTLFKRLEALKTKVTLPEDLFEAMTELKALGNDAAHIDARDYKSVGEAEAADSIELAKEILKSRYQLKGLVERLRARKSIQALE